MTTTMAIQNCKRCRKPFNQQGNVLICQNCAHDESQLFNDFFKRILRKKDQVDTQIAAEVLQCSESDLKEVLDFCCGHRGAKILKGLQRGKCYLCSSRLLNPESPEPVCTGCVELMQDVFFSNKFKLPELKLEKGATLPVNTDQGEKVERKVYEEILAENRKLKAIIEEYNIPISITLIHEEDEITYPPEPFRGKRLSTETVLMTDDTENKDQDSPSKEESQAAPQALQEPEVEEIDEPETEENNDVLSIIDGDDDFEVEELMSSLSGVGEQEQGLRQYGFKRLD